MIFPGPFAIFPPAPASVVSAFPLWAFWREQIKDGLNAVCSYTEYAFGTQHQHLTLHLTSERKTTGAQGFGTADAGVCCFEGGKRGTLAAVDPTLWSEGWKKHVKLCKWRCQTVVRCYRHALYHLQQVPYALWLTRMLTSFVGEWCLSCLKFSPVQPSLWRTDVRGFYIHGATLCLNGHSGGWYC